MLRRALARLRTPHGFAVLSLVALAGLWAIVPSGAFVRLTASGLGCPDWPLCDGRVVPEASGHAWIEFTNRVFSGLVMLVAVATWVVARRLPGRPVAIRRLAFAIALTTAAQVPLGAVTVLYDLHPLLVGAHFLLSMVALGAGTALAVAAWDRRRGATRRWDRRRGPLAVATLVALGALLVTGVLVTAAGPHSGDLLVTRRVGDFSAVLHLHVRAAVVFLVLAAVLAAWIWREGGADRATRLLAGVTVPLTLLQIGLGELQYRNGLPWQVVAVHVSVAALLWLVGCALVAHAARPALPAPQRRRDLVWQGTQRSASGTALSRPSGISSPQSTQIP